MASILEQDIEPAFESMIYKLRDARVRYLDAEYPTALDLLRDVTDDLMLTHLAIGIIWVKEELRA